MVGGGNEFPPTVVVTDTNVQLNNSVWMGYSFTVSDLDANSEVERLRFRDASTAPQTGYLTVDGVVQQPGLAFEIAASQINSVFYHAGAIIGSELVSVEAFDGVFWSSLATGVFSSVVENLTPPEVSGTDFSVPTQGLVSISQFMSAVDPDGYPILDYLVYDTSGDPNGGDLVLDGVTLASHQWHMISAGDIDRLRFRGGTYGTTEEIKFQARDQDAWSGIAGFNGTTLPNLNDPVATAKTVSLQIGDKIPVSEMVQYSDADGNELQSLGLLDTGFAAQSGYFEKNGVRMDAGTMFWTDASELGNVFYVAGSIFSVEEFKTQAWDGQRISAITAADAFTADSPTITSVELQMIDSLQELRLADMITVTTSISPTSYQVIDLNPEVTSSKLVVNGVEYDPSEIHTISAVDFENTYIRGGLDDLGRSLDEFIVRADTGFATSAWQGVTVSTDPVNQNALLEIGRWQYDTDFLELTYNFPATVPQYYCSQGFDECGDFMALTDPGMRGAVRDVLDNYENFFKIRFTEVSSNVNADITFAGSDTNPDAGGYAYGPLGAIPGTYDVGGDIFFTSSQIGAAMQSNPGEYGYALWIHEMGHALGLAHPFDHTVTLPPSIDNTRYSVMSYTGAYFDESTGREIHSETPMLYDFMALQTLYGGNPNYRLGDTQIKFDRENTLPQIVYDAGGKDTFNLNNHTLDSVIDLREGQFSSVGGLTENVGIAWGTSIENARGGSGNDTLIGNESNNFLLGNDGVDRLIGGGGPDYLRGMAGNDIYGYTIGDGNDTIQELFGAGRDRIEVQLFDEYFDDMEDDLGGNALLDNFEFRADGLDLEIRLTLDGDVDNGSIRIDRMGWGRNRVETLRLVNTLGEQVGPDISLLSIYTLSDGNFAPFQVTNNTSTYGNLAVQA